MVQTVQKPVEIAELQILDKVLTRRSLCNDTCPWSHRAAGPRGVSTVAVFWDKVPTGLTVQKPVEILQLQILDKFVICPSLYNDRCPRS